MNATDKNSTALETLSLVAVVSCVLASFWFLMMNVMA